MPKKSSTNRRKPGASGQHGGQRSAQPAQQSAQQATQQRARSGATGQTAARVAQSPQTSRATTSQTQAQASRMAPSGARNGAANKAAAAGSPLAGIRERRPPKQVTRSRRRMRKSWWQGYTPVVAAVVVVGALVGLFVLLSHGQGGNTASAQGTPVPSGVLNDVTQINPNVFATVGTGGNANPTHAIPSAPLTGSNGKPQFLYMGAEYCPFCAAERWSMVVALSRFGTFKNLHLTTSSSSDVYPNTNTFTFYGSSYTSQYIDFASVEETTRDQNTPLQAPTAEQQQIISTYDKPPYVPSNLANGIPFVDIGGRYVVVSSGFSPQDIANLSWSDIASKLSDPNDKVTQDIVGNANWLTAAICKSTGDKPANVCTTSTIQQIEKQLP